MLIALFCLRVCGAFAVLGGLILALSYLRIWEDLDPGTQDLIVTFLAAIMLVVIEFGILSVVLLFLGAP